MGMSEETHALAGRLAANLRQLREARGLTQEQIAKLAGLPRATWGHLESGEANPTLSVLHRAALALQVPIEELTAEGRRLLDRPPQLAGSPRIFRGDDSATRQIPVQKPRIFRPPRSHR